VTGGCGDRERWTLKAGVAMALTALEMLTEADLLGKEIVASAQ